MTASLCFQAVFVLGNHDALDYFIFVYSFVFLVGGSPQLKADPYSDGA